MKKFSGTATWLIITVMVMITSFALWEGGKNKDTIHYSDFKQSYIKDEVKSIRVKQDNITIEGTLMMERRLLYTRH